MIACRAEWVVTPGTYLCTVCGDDVAETMYVLVEDGDVDNEQYACRACRNTYLDSEATLPGMSIRVPGHLVRESETVH
jgi:hypothetical protein